MEKEKTLDSIKLDKIYSKDEFEEMDNIHHEYCLKEASYHRQVIRRASMYSSYISFDHASFIERRSEEIANRTSYEKLNEIEKQTIASHIALPDDESLIKVLLSNGISLRTVTQLNTFLPVIKRIAKEGRETPVSIQWQKNVSIICYRLKRYFGVSQPHIILNRINDILANNLELFEELSNERGKQKTMKVSEN